MAGKFSLKTILDLYDNATVTLAHIGSAEKKEGREKVSAAQSPAAPVTMPLSAKLAQIEREARREQYIHKDTALWLIAELRERMAQLVTIDARVRDACKQIDDVLEKCEVPT